MSIETLLLIVVIHVSIRGRDRGTPTRQEEWDARTRRMYASSATSSSFRRGSEVSLVSMDDLDPIVRAPTEVRRGLWCGDVGSREPLLILLDAVLCAEFCKARHNRARMASAASLARRRVCALVLSRAHAGSGVCGSYVARPLIVDPNVYVSRSEISTSTSVCVSSSGSRSGSSRRAATEDTPGVLLRDFLTSALYDNTHGYFSQPDVPVGSFPTPIAFRTLLGADDYNRVLADKYSKLTKQWLTPVEIFKPHYSQAVARYVLDVYTTHDLPNGYPLLVYELGGGAGTHAVGFLELIRYVFPNHHIPPTDCPYSYQKRLLPLP